MRGNRQTYLFKLMNNLDRILDDAMALPLNQQEMLMKILQRRIVERRRDEIAQDAIESLAEFRSGQLKPQTATEAIAELRSFIENDKTYLGNISIFNFRSKAAAILANIDKECPS
jgi:hypothetical protein